MISQYKDAVSKRIADRMNDVQYGIETMMRETL